MEKKIYKKSKLVNTVRYTLTKNINNLKGLSHEMDFHNVDEN